ncbi:MAG: hypothetical protein AVDCRST_MAG05-1838 [uncultured Rubrobacteraceae bacterium]|uniref:Uncharacterized protein n=1 Tax=uncultured Rubrobacteraceae bacterium TaxID=349277 RepID=A0A6J4SE38_9ACTN|nr:MAG: hypothetical protein AVDCRST_MAG05-1838 [uncultured Rubrobacteraceae bacterium]
MWHVTLTCSLMLGNVVISLAMPFLEGVVGYIIVALRVRYGQRW